MTVKHLFPAVEPSLNLDFANSKKLDPRITFTRSSTGTYVDSNGLIKTAAANEARFDHDPISGSSLGLLVEESRTNLLTYSEQFDNAAWNKANATVTANSVTSPDGTSTADEVRGNSNSSAHIVYQSSLNISAGSITSSIFAKAKETSKLGLYIGAGNNSGTGVVDLSNGTVIQQPSNGTIATPTYYGNGWYRIVLTYTATASANGECNWYILPNTYTSGTFNVPADEGLYFWGAQLEAGYFPTSYIPTSGSTVTRSADVASMTGTNFSSWYNQTEGSWYIDYNKKLAPVNISNVGIIGPQHLYYRGNSSEALRRFGSNTPATGIAANQNKVALAYGSSDFDICANGNATVNNYSVATPTGQTTAHIMSDGSNYLTSHVSRLTYYPYRLTDAQLEALTL